MDQLKRELKEWEHDFITKYKRSPKKNDIDCLPLIKLKYKKYSKFKKLGKVNNTPIKRGGEQVVDGGEDEDTFYDEEIGPTPQIYGKSIGLFELNLSPVKKRLDLTSSEGSSEGEGPDDGESDDLGNETVVKSSYGPNSPMKIETNLKLYQRTPIKQEEEEAPMIINGISPSPIFKRSLTKSLKELETEYQNVRKELKLDEIKEEDEDEETVGEDPEESVPPVQEPQRKKRKGIAKRVDSNTKEEEEEEEERSHKEINLHAMLRNLKRQKLKEFIDKQSSMGISPILTNKLELEDIQLNHHHGDKNNDTTSKKKEINKRKRRAKKYNLVSNNFRRLKLPNKSRRNGNWRRRR